jgi:transposase-like protein
MATRTQIQELKEKETGLTNSQRTTRYFSEEFKRAKVKEIEKGITKISEICREYHVRDNSVYKWIYKYSMTRKKGTRMVVELESDTLKLKQLRDQLRDYERLIGQKQIKIDFLEKLIEIAGEELGHDLKKKYGSIPFSGFGNEENSTLGA